ncbi:MAG TPA: hypothetical protein DHU33_05020 [Firmicutes bacterium]|nr:hypothetical protein [Bacillota bacterium]
MNLDEIGKFITKQRQSKNLTQQELADRLNVTNKAVSKWENGRSMPDVGLFNGLCSELDISLNELLSGKKDNKNNNDEAILKFLKNTTNKSKIVILSSIFAMIFLLIIFGLFLYFINNYNKIKVYNLSGTSENFNYKEGLFFDTNQEYFYTYGLLEPNDINLDFQILGIALKSDDELLFEDQYRTGGYLSEYKGYNEIFTEDRVNNINNWTLEIRYYDNTNKIEKIESIKVISKLEIVNNNFISKKFNSIAGDGSSNNNSSLIVERKKSLEVLKKYLEENNYSLNKNGNYIKKNKYGLFSIELDPYTSKVVNFKDDIYIINFDPFYQNYTFIEKNSYDYIVSYIRRDNSISCEFECPADMSEIIDKYLKIFDSEFSEIIPHKDNWMHLVTNDGL